MNASLLSQLGQRTQDPPISWLMKMTLDHPGLISLAAGFTDNVSLPCKETRALFDEIFKSSKTGRSALQYGSTAGDSELRQLTAFHIQKLDLCEDADGLHTSYDPDRLLITNGSQQFLYILTEALCDPGDIVLVEDPTYFVFLGMAQSHGLRCRAIRMHQDGIDLQHLFEVLESLRQSGKLNRLKFIYLVTYFQNPSGRTTSFAKKKAILELLRNYERLAGHPIFLLEDAAYRELRFADLDVPSALASFSDRVIYSGTYSKPFATGARVGFGILPEHIYKVAHRIKGNHDFGTANLLQQLMVCALRGGEYEKHLQRLRTRYTSKMKAMTQAMKKHFPKSVVWEQPKGGLYVWARMPASMETGVNSRLFKSALENEVLYVPGELCYAEDSTRPKPNREMRLSFGGSSERDIEIGIKRLGQVIHSNS